MDDKIDAIINQALAEDPLQPGLLAQPRLFPL